MKVFILLLIYFNIAFATAYNFTETRYSDALDRLIEFKGQIDFLKDGLIIKYPSDDKVLDYQNGNLTYFEKEKEQEIDKEKIQKITQYFDILMMLHNDDETTMKNVFEISKEKEKTELKPMGVIKNYIKNIELQKEDKKLKQIKLFLKNGDYILIRIDNEIP